MTPSPLLLALSLSASSALAALPAPVAEPFDSLPDDLTAGWTQGPITWTSSVSVDPGDSGDSAAPLVWTAFNARRDAVSPDRAPAIALQSTNAATKGWLLSDPIPTSLQRISFDARRVFSGRDLSSDLYVNDVKILSLRSQNPTNQTDTVSVETVDPATGLPFAPPVTLFFSNSLAGAGIAIDDITLVPFTLFVTLDKPASNSIALPAEEFSTVEKEFNVVATPNLPPGAPGNAVVTGSWTVTPGFSGGMSDLDAPHLTLVPSAADAGKTFTLSYTATISVPEPDEPDGTRESPENPENPPPASFSHTASCTLSVSLAPAPRFLDFEDAPFLNKYDPDGISTHLSGGNFTLQNIIRSDKTDPKIGNFSVRLYHQSATNPAAFSSDFFYPDGLGTLSFRYANYSAENPSMTLVVQARGEDDEDWSTLPDGTLVATNHGDIDDFEFRVFAGLPGPQRFRILSTSGVTPSAPARVNIDDLRVRPCGSNAPVLLFRGSPLLPADTSWSAFFCYTNPAPGLPHAWSWSLSDPGAPGFPALSCTTNEAENRLEFSAAPSSFSIPATNVLTVSVSVGGVVDQQLSVPLVATPSPPSFDLFSAFDPCTNIVDVFTTNIVLCDGTATNCSVAWSVEPPFSSGTNSYARRDRYRVKDIVQTNTTTHLLTAVLTDKSTPYQLAATNVLSVTVVPAAGDDPTPPPGPVFTSIVPSPASSTLVLTWTGTDPAVLVSTPTLGTWPDTGILTNSPASLPLPDSPAFYRLLIP